MRWRCLHPGIQNSAVHKTGQAKHIYKPVHAHSDPCRVRAHTQRKQTHQRFFHCSVPVFLSTGYKSVCFFSVGYHCLFQHSTPALGCVFPLPKLSLALTTQDQHPSQHSTRALPSVQNINDSLNTVHQHFFLLLQLACPPASASSSPDRPLHTQTQQALSL